MACLPTRRSLIICNVLSGGYTLHSIVLHERDYYVYFMLTHDAHISIEGQVDYTPHLTTALC